MARWRWPLALVLSCTVYLIPFVGPHMVQFLGEWLTRTLTRTTGRPWPWVAAEIASVVVLQAIAFVTWYWILGRPLSVRPLVLVALVPAAIFTMNWLFLIVLPTRFLIDPEEAPDRATWPIACTVPNESLTVLARRSAIVSEHGEATFVQNSTGRIARLLVTESADGRVACEVVALGGPMPTSNLTPLWVGDGGQMLLQRIDPKTGVLSWEWMAARGAPAVPLIDPAGGSPGRAAPVVAQNSAAIAWLIPIAASGHPPKWQIIVQSMASATTAAVIPLDRLEPASFVLLDVNSDAREVLLAINERGFAAIGFDGAIRWGPLRPDGVEALSMTFRRAGAGWVAWDGYKEGDGYVIAWALPAGTGRHRVPRGSGVTDLAVHPGGRLVALSTTTTLSIGRVRDSVVALSTADGRDVFRRVLPRSARSTVAFPTRTLFAYSEWDGTRAEVRVLRIPPELSR